jgi:hypothetical protein
MGSTAFCGLFAGAASAQCETGVHIAEPGQANAWFGKVLAMSDELAVIPAYHAQPGGAAHAFRWAGRGWIQEGELPSPDAGFGDSYGRGAAVSDHLAVIGAPDHDGDADRSGAAYVFERTDGVWAFSQKLLALDGDDVDQFGWSTGIAGDSILVGARGDAEAGVNAGAVYVFQRDESKWRQTQKLFETNPTWAEGGSLGFSMATTDDRFIVGAPWHNGNGANHGAALVYREANGAWTLEARLFEPGDGQPDTFGLSVGISETRAVVGAPRHVVPFRGSTGAAMAYRRSGSSWAFQQRLVAADSAFDDNLGYAVAISPGAIVAGAYGNNDGFGSAYVFREVGGVWVERATILPSDFRAPDPLGAPPWFGMMVGLSGDRALIAAPHDDNSNGGDAGTVYAFSGFIEVDCNENGVADGCDVAIGESDDANGNGIPDECELGACCFDGTCENTTRDECFDVGACVRDPEWLCDGDVDGDGQVNPVDAGLVQAAFGSDDEQSLCNYDLDCDGQINPVDAGIVQSLFGTCAAPRGVCSIPPRWFVGEDCDSFECP